LTGVNIVADRNVCIGAGMCVLTDDAVFDQDDDGIVLLRCDTVAADQQQRIREAVNLCPSAALSLRDD
jgi:ferredoxin